MIVLKFGGTSVGRVENIQKIKAILQWKNEPYVLVVSAFSGVTNLLEKMANESIHGQSKALIDELINKHRQMIVDLKISEIACSSTIDNYLESIQTLSNGIESLCELSNRTLAKMMSYGELMSSTIVFYSFLLILLIWFMIPR